MPIDTLLAVMKFVLLGLLYLFLFRVVRVMVLDLRGRRDTAPPARGGAVTVPTPAPSSKPVRRPPRELVVHPPEGAPTVVRLDQSSMVLGRSPAAEVLVDDHYASDEHARIRSGDNGHWTVQDLGSTNGTFVNGAKVTSSTDLHSGDQIRIGKTRIEVRR